MELRIEDLSLRVDAEMFFSRVKMNCASGRLSVILGETGSGKTSLLRAIAGLLSADTGSVWLGDVDISKRKPWARDVAMVYQQFINYPHLTVAENVAYPLQIRKGLGKDAIKSKVEAVLELVGLTGFADRRPGELSGGQQQRVAFARALVREPAVLLLDEPFANLDFKLRERFRSELKALVKRNRNTVVLLATSDPAEAYFLADSLIVMHQGRVLQQDRPDNVWEHPLNAEIGRVTDDPQMNLASGSLHDGRIRLESGAEFEASGRLTRLDEGSYIFGFRASDLYVSETGAISGRVAYSEVSGSFSRYVIILGKSEEWHILEAGVRPRAVNSAIRIGFRRENVFVFATSEERSLLSSPD